MIRLVIVSDIRLYCEGLAEILGQKKTVRVVSTASNVNEAIREIEQHSPDVVLLDMTMKASCQAIRYVIASCPVAKVVALAVPEDENNILACAEAGITGYVAREASLNELLNAVQGAVKGELYCPPRIAASLMSKIKILTGSIRASSEEAYQKPADSILSTLTQRERQIAKLISDGLSNKQIAHHLTIEVSTVKNHVHNILVKMGVESRMQAASLFQRQALSALPGSLDLDPNLDLHHMTSS